MCLNISTNTKIVMYLSPDTILNSVKKIKIGLVLLKVVKSFIMLNLLRIGNLSDSKIQLIYLLKEVLYIWQPKILLKVNDILILIFNKYIKI